MKNLRKSALIAVALIVSANISFGQLFSRSTEATDGNADLGLAPYNGIKHAIAVLPFENTSFWKGDFDLQENMTIMLSNVLFQSDRFVVVDRESIEDTLAEQDLQSSGRASAASNVAQTGQIRSARYLARARITGVETQESGQGGGLRIRGVTVGASGGRAQIEMIIDIFDSSTSQVLASQRIVGKAGNRSFNIGYSERRFGGTVGGFSKTPIGEAAYDCIAQAVRFMAGQFEDYKIEGTVVTVAGDGRVVINLGSQYNVGVGDRFQIREVGEVLIDPGTGEILDRLEGDVTGVIRVTRVTDRVSYCELESGELPVRGDSVTAI